MDDAVEISEWLLEKTEEKSSEEDDSYPVKQFVSGFKDIYDDMCKEEFTHNQVKILQFGLACKKFEALKGADDFGAFCVEKIDELVEDGKATKEEFGMEAAESKLDTSTVVAATGEEGDSVNSADEEKD